MTTLKEKIEKTLDLFERGLTSVVSHDYLNKDDTTQALLSLFREEMMRVVPEIQETQLSTGGVMSHWVGWNACRQATINNIGEIK
jgi:hypothetical protein